MFFRNQSTQSNTIFLPTEKRALKLNHLAAKQSEEERLADLHRFVAQRLERLRLEPEMRRLFLTQSHATPSEAALKVIEEYLCQKAAIL